MLARLPHEGLTVHVPPGALLWADADLMAAALINLMDNAVRAAATELRLTLVVRDGQQTLQLQDNGRGVTAERRAELSDVLARQNYEGRTGLGLMLADLVARAHGGRLLLPVVAQGFAVELQLGPAATQPAQPGPASP